MGCNCGGSQQAEKKLTTPTKQRAASRQASPARRTGGPGQVGYTWNGPPRITEKQ